ncbi:MAG TPA: FdhF/YdeP family oxidoreductase [Aliidongia sp.]|uniref:FdhF/YdeP family oxidoreductase n=1 Tax=Aliidongia sp. TaxID=1914230 RepID=UPI002DDD8EFE|nr:FdhF/YdeP family oxidoreductase [Aliidongia sp.]HEV2673319.1 FdhF/YdeP family oxidoreductase [Aliidongia sp.]
MCAEPSFTPYDAPAGGWGSVRSLFRNLAREHVPASGSLVLARQNKPDGFACVSCAWAKPAEPHPFEFCENGAKATAWEITTRRAEPSFFAAHTLAELESWPDHDLEELGRLTHPMRWDAASDRYLPVSWQDAFQEIGRELKAIEPDQAVFYASGRGSLETAYMYALFARLYGTNNLPDCSNMCHESTSVALPESIGVPVGTVTLDDFPKTDCIFIVGHNIGSNAPRMLHDLQDASRRGVPIITFNPLRERGLVEFTNPQAPFEMLSGQSTPISSQYHQVKAGGDIAALMGLCKALLAADDAAQAAGEPRLLDTAFIAEHTHGFDEFAAAARGYGWEELERRSGLTRGAMEAAARAYGEADAVIGVYGMGLTQHRMGVENVQMLVNLLLMRGNIGREGAGICPVRGHSNVQGQRTVGMTEKPELAPLDKLKEMYGFEPPREKGVNTIETCEGVIAGTIKAFIGLGGNFVRAVPDRDAVEPAWRRLRLTVQIATKLNRSHLIHGEISYVLPCLGRIEIDNQASGPQSVSVEDSTSCIHGSLGMRTPASPDLLSEPAIVAGIAKATLPPNPNVAWDAWVGDYSTVRDAIAQTYPEAFHGFNERMWTPGGFHRPLPARHRQWKTKTGKANFITPRGLAVDIDRPDEKREILQLITLRSNDQFNTTIYGYDDRFRGIQGTRLVVLMNRNDMARLGLAEGDRVRIVTDAGDDRYRAVDSLRVTTYDIPEGCCGGYYPECNPLIPLWHHAERAKVPAAKSIPVRIERIEGAEAIEPHPVDAVATPFADMAADVGAGGQVAGTLVGQAVRRKPFRAMALALAVGAIAGWRLARRR